MEQNRNFEYISSKDNPKVKLFSKLVKEKARTENKLFLAEGVKLTMEAAQAGIVNCILVRESEFEKGAFDGILKDMNTEKVFVLSEPAFAKITTENAPQGIIAVCAFPTFHYSSAELEKLDGKYVSDMHAVILDGIRDPGNMGTILRSALAFGFDTVIIGDCVDIYNPKTVRAAMGALFNISIVRCENLPEVVEKLAKKRRVFGAALKENCLTLGEYEKKKDDIIVIGNEGHGISRAVLDACSDFVKIPMGEMSESLNAAIAASVLMWEYRTVNQ